MNATRSSRRVVHSLRLFCRNIRHFSAAHGHAQIPLRPYQKDCVEACLDALNSGVTRFGVSLPTGSGKTVVFLSLLDRMSAPPEHPQATRALIIVNSIQLAEQIAHTAKQLFPHWTVEIEQGITHVASGTADVTIGTYQTLRQRLAKFELRSLKAVIVDEAHHSAASSYRRILSHFDPNLKHSDGTSQATMHPRPIPIVGFSATFYPGEKRKRAQLGRIFQSIVYHKDIIEMIEEEWLSKPQFTTVDANIDFGKIVVEQSGEFATRSLAAYVDTEIVNKLIVQTWMDKAAQRRSTLVFCVTVAHVRHLTSAFQAAGVDARCVYARIPSRQRHILINSFKHGEFPVLVNCGVLSEGADIPNIDCVILARPTRSPILLAQMIGRGLRLSPGTGKKDCQIIDFVDVTAEMFGAISAPSLFNPKKEPVDNETRQSPGVRKAGDVEVDLSNYSDLSKIRDPRSVRVVNYTFEERYIQSRSSNAWVNCENNAYVLQCFNQGYIHISKKFGESRSFTARYYPPRSPKETTSPQSPQSRLIVNTAPLSQALRICDTYAKTHVLKGNEALGLSRHAKWRRYLASESQKKVILSFWNAPSTVDKFEEDAVDQKFPRLTKGEAADMITRLMHNARTPVKEKAYATQDNNPAV